MWVEETRCHECPECVHCGRKEETVIWHVCDRCNSDEQLYKYNSEELCAECLLGEFEQVDMEE